MTIHSLQVCSWEILSACISAALYLHKKLVDCQLIWWPFSCICAKLAWLFFIFPIVIEYINEPLFNALQTISPLRLSSLIAARSLVWDRRWSKAIGTCLRGCLCKERKPVLFSAKKRKKNAKKRHCTVSVLRLLSAAACREVECRRPIQLWGSRGAPSVER